MAMEAPAYVISASSHSAALFRQAAQSLIEGTGVVGAADLGVTQNGTPNMSVNVAAGVVWCPGTLGGTAGMQTNLNAQTGYGLPAGLTAQGSYCAYNDAAVNLAIAAADPTNPRIDIVCAAIQDAAYAGATNTPVLQVITGTPAPSPSAPAAPASAVVVAQIAVAAGVTSIVTANLTDKRPFATGGVTTVATVTGLSGTVKGQIVYALDAAGLFIWTGTGWVPPPGSFLSASSSFTSSVTSSGATEVVGTGSGLTLASVSLIANRWYSVEWTGRLSATAAAGALVARIRTSTGTVTTSSSMVAAAQVQATALGGAAAFDLTVRGLFFPASTGAWNFALTVAQATGASNCVAGVGVLGTVQMTLLSAQ